MCVCVYACMLVTAYTIHIVVCIAYCHLLHIFFPGVKAMIDIVMGSILEALIMGGHVLFSFGLFVSRYDRNTSGSNAFQPAGSHETLGM